MSSDELESLNPFMFKDLLSLQYLRAQSNSLKWIEPSTFKNLVNLKLLIFYVFGMLKKINLEQIMGNFSIIDLFFDLENLEHFEFDQINKHRNIEKVLF
jgi:hypothetical protein